MRKKSFLSNVPSRSWAKQTQTENKLAKQVYSLEKQGFADLPDTTGLPQHERIRLLQEAKADAVKEIKSNITNAYARKGGDADLRVKAALNEMEGKDLKDLKRLLEEIKEAKSNGESTEALYSSLWQAMDSSRAVIRGKEDSNIDVDYQPF